MKRFLWNELSPARLLNGMSRRLQSIPHVLAWKYSKTSYDNNTFLSTYIGRHFGERCFILANGPSLSEMDLSLLENEITFGLNRIYLMFDQLRFHPTYYICVNELVLDQFHDDIRSLTMPKFINWNRRNLFRANKNATGFVNLSLGLSDHFCQNMTQLLYSGGTVTYVALQIAFSMGFSEVIIIGLDHSFADKGTPNKVEIRASETDVNHFHPNYFPKGSKWQLPDLRRSEIAYHIAKVAYENDGRKIIDATVNGKCDVFEKQNYSSLF